MSESNSQEAVIESRREKSQFRILLDNLLLGIKDPKQFYSSVYPRLTSTVVLGSYALVIVISAILSLVANRPMVNSLVFFILGVISLYGMATLIYFFGKLLCQLDRTFNDVVNLTALVGTYGYGANIVAAFIGFLLFWPSFWLFVAAIFYLYILATALRYGLRFSRGQVGVFTLIPASLTALLGLVLSVSSVFVSQFPVLDSNNVSKATEQIASDHGTFAMIDSLINAEEVEGKSDGGPSIPTLKMGESYQYRVDMSTGSVAHLQLLIEPSDDNDQLRLHYVLTDGLKVAKHSVLVAANSKLNSIPTNLAIKESLGTAEAPLRGLIILHTEGNSAVLDGMATLVEGLSFLIPMDKLEESGLSLDRETVTIAGRTGVKRRLTKENGLTATFARDHTLSVPLLEASSSQGDDFNGLTLVRYQPAS